MSTTTGEWPEQEHAPTQMEYAAERALSKADNQAANWGRRARWVPEANGWVVASSREGEPPSTVRRKKPAAEVAAASEGGEVQRSGAKRGYWWFVLDCNCPAALSGYAVCWHKASVFRWWQDHRRVDGKAYADHPAITTPELHATLPSERLARGQDWEPHKDRSRPIKGSAHAAQEQEHSPQPVYYDLDVTREEWVRVNPDVPLCEWCEGAPFCEVECSCPECVDARSPLAEEPYYGDREDRP